MPISRILYFVQNKPFSLYATFNNHTERFLPHHWHLWTCSQPYSMLIFQKFSCNETNCEDEDYQNAITLNISLEYAQVMPFHEDTATYHLHIQSSSKCSYDETICKKHPYIAQKYFIKICANTLCQWILSARLLIMSVFSTNLGWHIMCIFIRLRALHLCLSVHLVVLAYGHSNETLYVIEGFVIDGNLIILWHRQDIIPAKHYSSKTVHRHQQDHSTPALAPA